jgi:hypothetical protein
MSYHHDAPTLALLTREEVGLRLNLTPRLVDGLVKTGELSPVRVSSGTDRRFWPDEILAYALHASITEDAAADAQRRHGLTAEPEVEAAVKPRAGRAARHPAWPPFTGPTEHRVPAYIAFADREHLVNYLRRRAQVELA